MITWGIYYWPYFIVLASLLFLVPEAIAFFTNTANTLSEYAWHELNVNPRIPMHTIAWYTSLVGWLLFVVVITAHIWFRRFA